MSEPIYRLDVELVRRGLARSRGDARELIVAGSVHARGQIVRKAALPVTATEELILDRTRDEWVSRSAYKLVAALEAFVPHGLQVRGRRCIDVGACTGGFTQVLLRHGAREVVALDVGHGQLAPQLTEDQRVVERSGVNVRDTSAAELGGPADLLVADLSFISLGLVLPVLAKLTTPDGDMVLLVKPQFEVGRERLAKGGIVRSAADRAGAIRDVAGAASRAGLATLALRPSPIRGTAGNAEFLLWCTPRAGGGLSRDAVAEAAAAAAVEASEAAEASEASGASGAAEASGVAQQPRPGPL